MDRLVSVKIYETDKEILKQMESPSIAQAVKTLLHGRKQDFKEIVEVWGLEYINPKIEQIRKTLSEQIGQEIERRFKELSSK